MVLTEIRSTSRRQGLHSIQHLRAIAALLVVSFHLNLIADQIGINSKILGFIARFGELGVDIFFVLSGFLMIYATKKKTPGLATALEFMRARVARIVPLYWILTIAYASLLFILPTLFDEHPFDIYQLLTSLLFIPSYDSGGHVVPVIYTGWTLNYEMFFYVIFAGTLTLTRKYIFPIVAAMFAFLSLLSLVNAPGLMLRIYANPMLLEFVVGCAIALIYIDGRVASWKFARGEARARAVRCPGGRMRSALTRETHAD